MPVIQGHCGRYSADTVQQIDVCLARLYDNARRSKDPVRAVQLLDDADALLEARTEMTSSDAHREALTSLDELAADLGVNLEDLSHLDDETDII